MKYFIKLDDDIRDWNKYEKILELPTIFRAISGKGDDGIGLNKINYINARETKRNITLAIFNITIQLQKIKTVFVYSPYKQFLSEGF